MTRVELDIRGFSFPLAINPIEYQEHLSFINSVEPTVMATSVYFDEHHDPRLRKMVWRNLPNYYPYDHMVSGMRSTIGISGVRMKVHDMNISGDQNEWQTIFVEDVRVVLRKGAGPKKAINSMAYDVELIYGLG